MAASVISLLVLWVRCVKSVSHEKVTNVIYCFILAHRKKEKKNKAWLMCQFQVLSAHRWKNYTGSFFVSHHRPPRHSSDVDEVKNYHSGKRWAPAFLYLDFIAFSPLCGCVSAVPEETRGMEITQSTSSALFPVPGNEFGANLTPSRRRLRWFCIGCCFFWVFLLLFAFRNVIVNM